MNPLAQQILDQQYQFLDVSRQAQQALLDGMSRMAAVNIQAARSALADSVDGAKAALSAGEGASAQRSMPAVLEKAAAWTAECQRIAGETAAALMSLSTQPQPGGLRDEWLAAFDAAAQAMPAGAPLVQAARSAVANVWAGFEQMAAAAKAAEHTQPARRAAGTNA